MWCSVHIYHERLDALLSGCVAPLVTLVEERGLITQFFFLRYWERGVHVRLRTLSPDHETAAIARQAIEQGVRTYLERSPSVRTLDEATYATVHRQLAALERLEAGDPGLAPNDSISVQAYEPEYGKYGGERGVAIAEALFDRSSRTVLATLPALGERGSMRLGLGFSMMMLALRHFGVPVERMGRFFGLYGEIWSAYPDAGATVHPSRLARMRAQLLPRARALLAGEVPQHIALRDWADAVARSARAIDEHADEVLPHLSVAGGAEARRASLLVQYMHTHNNRLGLAPAEEAYLARLGASVMEVLA